MSFIKIEQLYKIYSGYVDTVAIENFDLEIEQGEIIAIIGASGSGKSTLLSCIGGMIRPNSGSIRINNNNIKNFSESELAEYRRKTIGFVFQNFNLIDELTVYENVSVPLLIDDHSNELINERVDFLLTELSIDRYKTTYPRYLSGGEQQRVSIAVALANDPDIIIADEPTGNLDSDTSKQVMNLLIGQSKKHNKTLIIATHDRTVMELVDRSIDLSSE